MEMDEAMINAVADRLPPLEDGVAGEALMHVFGLKRK